MLLTAVDYAILENDVENYDVIFKMNLLTSSLNCKPCNNIKVLQTCKHNCIKYRKKLFQGIFLSYANHNFYIFFFLKNNMPEEQEKKQRKNQVRGFVSR